MKNINLLCELFKLLNWNVKRWPPSAGLAAAHAPDFSVFLIPFSETTSTVNLRGSLSILVDHTLPGGAVVKNPPTNVDDVRDVGLVPGSGRSPGVGNGTHSSILAWEIPWTEEPDRLQSMGSQKVGHDWACQDDEWKLNHSSKLTSAWTFGTLSVNGILLAHFLHSAFPGIGRVGWGDAEPGHRGLSLGMARLGESQTSSAGPQTGEYPLPEVSMQTLSYGMRPLNITWDCTRWTLKPLSTWRGRGFMFWKMPLKKSRSSNFHFHPEGKQEMS